MIVSGYEDMLENVTGKKCLAFVEFGSYQGEWIGVLDAGSTIELWEGIYGSCSGCDFIQSYDDAEGGYNVPDEDAKRVIGEHPFLTIPREIMERCTVEEFQTLIPANRRNDIYEFDGVQLFNKIKKGLEKRIKNENHIRLA